VKILKICGYNSLFGGFFLSLFFLCVTVYGCLLFQTTLTLEEKQRLAQQQEQQQRLKSQGSLTPAQSSGSKMASANSSSPSQSKVRRSSERASGRVFVSDVKDSGFETRKGQGY
jgi:hypothetical protein